MKGIVSQTQGSQRIDINDVGYLEAFMRLCITWGGADFKGPSESCDRLKMTPSKTILPAVAFELSSANPEGSA
jgi:hypothetical protein